MLIIFEVKLELFMLIVRFIHIKENSFDRIHMESEKLFSKSKGSVEIIKFKQKRIFSLKDIFERISEMKDVKSIFGLRRQ